jgi:hypothetical protein
MLPTAPPALEVRYEAPMPASLYWLVNALAGGDQHVNAEAYRADWHPRPDDAPNLAEFRRLRDAYRGALPDRAPRENGYLPMPPSDGTEVATRFANCFLAADTMDQAWQRVDGLLTEDDAHALRRVMEHFQPRFERKFRQLSYLGAYRTAFQRFGRQAGLDAWLARASRFYGVAPGTPLHPRVTFVYSPPAQRTHGRRLGGNLIVEVLPGEKPADRVDVVAHELSHYFWGQAGLEDDPAFVQAFFQAGGADAGAALGLANEALATAIGQGVVEEALAPAAFKRSLARKGSWYADDAIEPDARAIFPAVKAALLAGTPVKQIVPQLVAGYRQAFAGQVPTPARVLTSYMLVLEQRRDPAFEGYFKRIPPRSIFGAKLDEGGAMWSKYRGLSGVVGVTAAQLPALAKLAGSYGLAPEDLDHAGPGVLIKTRPTGGYLFVVVAPDRPALGQALARFAALKSLPPGWTPLP